MCVCARARCKYESNFPVFFLPLRLRRRPRGSGRSAGAEVGGPSQAGAGAGVEVVLWKLVSHSCRLG